MPTTISKSLRDQISGQNTAQRRPAKGKSYGVADRLRQTGATAPAQIPQSEINAGTAAYRIRRSAQDRMLGLNVGQRPGGETLHPMMPGVPMGAVDPNYGGIGNRAWYFTDRANGTLPNGVTTEDRQQSLVEKYFGSGVETNTAMNCRRATAAIDRTASRHLAVLIAPAGSTSVDRDATIARCGES